MGNLKIKKSLLFFIATFGVFILFLSGFTVYYSSPAYSEGYYNVSVGAPNFAFSFGNGVNVYDAPMYRGYIYSYNGYYYRWLNSGWVYANVYGGPWYSVTTGIYLPGILAFGPPPPVVAYPGYFSWWKSDVSPWYRYHHPGWWGRHHMFLRNYRSWRSHANNYYNNRSYQNWRMRRPFERNSQGPRGGMQQQRGPAFRGQQGPRGGMQQQRGPAFRGQQGQHGRPMRAGHAGKHRKHRNN